MRGHEPAYASIRDDSVMQPVIVAAGVKMLSTGVIFAAAGRRVPGDSDAGDMPCDNVRFLASAFSGDSRDGWTKH